MIRAGYARVTDNRRHPDAVQWWFFRDDNDGWAFARGGSVRTMRDARRAIERAKVEAAHERTRLEQRPQMEFTKEGDLVPIERSPYELFVA